MATTLIRNGAVCGAIGAMTAGRAQTDFTPGDYATIVNAADAFASEFLVKNALLSVPMADADNAQIGQLCAHVVFGCLQGRTSSSATAADYAAAAAGAVALSKEAAAKLT